MNSSIYFHLNYKVWIVSLLFLVCFGCQSKQNNQKVNELVREGNILLEQNADITKAWKSEFVEIFTPENRSAFPSNRAMLRSHAENQIILLEKQKALSNGAADKFEQASELSNNEKEKKSIALFAVSFRKDAEINQLFEQQMKLFLDEQIQDSKVLETRFADLTQRIEITTKERDDLQAEGKEIISK